MVDRTTASTTSRCRDSRAPISENYSHLRAQIKNFLYNAVVRPYLAIVAVCAELGSSACRDKAPPARPPVASPAAPTQDGALRPLTSRDGGMAGADPYFARGV